MHYAFGLNAIGGALHRVILDNNGNRMKSLKLDTNEPKFGRIEDKIFDI